MKRTQYVEVEVCQHAGLDDRQFTYRWELETNPQIGELIEVSFGRRQSVAVIRKLSTSTNVPAKSLKSVARRLPYKPLPATSLQLADWLRQYYAAPTKAVWSSFIPSLLPRKQAPKRPDTKNKKVIQKSDISLSKKQLKSLDTICNADVSTSLLFGITGSGKTKIYEALIAQTLAEGRSVIVLAPEIILATHLGQRLGQRFGSQLHTTHSGLSGSARRNVWLHALEASSPAVYLGPRSALFLPIQNLGLIIIDEEHDGSYKQTQAPRYQANFVAAELARLTQARLLLGSATPSMQTLALSAKGFIQRVDLTERFGGVALPHIEVVQQPREAGVFIAPSLLSRLKANLETSHQSLILHNQRGSARRLMCNACASTVRCSYCDTPLVLHADLGRLVCHLCSRHQAPPALCPSCHQPDLGFAGFGTKALVEYLTKQLPTARIARLDRDSHDRDSQALEHTLLAMQRGSIDILVGTQMIAKGLDFPNLKLVGIVAADELLAGADYTATERGVSLMMQAAGRSGRQDEVGQVIIQSRKPERAIFNYIKHHDWIGFSKAELPLRQRFHYPPYRWLVKLSLGRMNLSRLEQDIETFANELRQNHQLQVLGPAIPVVGRQGKRYWRQLIVTSTKRSDLTKIVQALPAGWIADLDPFQVL